MKRSRPRWGGALLPWLGACLGLLAVLASATVPGARAQELKIEAPRFSLDRETNTYTYEDGRLSLGDLTLFASRMQVNTATGTVRADGYVRIETSTVTGTATALELDTSSRVGSLHGANLHDAQSGLYLRAAEVRIHPDGRLALDDCQLTACRPGTPGAWSISASSVELTPEGLGFAWNPRLSLGPVPVLWLPVLAWPTVQERRTGLLPPRLTRHGSSLERFDLGWRLYLPVFLNLGYDHDLTLTPEGIEKRGWALEAEYNYAFWEDQRGRLRLWGLRERDPRDPAEENTALTPAPTDTLDERQARFLGDWAHNQGLGEDGRLVLTWRHSSDGQVRREYDRVAELRPYRTYQASVSEQWDWVQSALTFEQAADYVAESVYATEAEDTDLALRPRLAPRLRLNVGGRLAEELPLAVAVGVDAARFEASQHASGRMTELSPSVSLPIPLGGAFELRPSLTRHFVAYTDLLGYAGLTPGAAGSTPTPQDDVAYAQTEGRLELRTAFARVFARDTGTYDAFKHRIEPRLLLTYVEDVAQPLADLVRPGRVRQELVTLRLDTTLLGRIRPAAGAGGGTVVRELLQVNLIQRYNVLRERNAPDAQGPVPGEDGSGPPLPQETEDGEPLLPLLLEVQGNGAAVSVDARANWHHQLERSTQRSLGVQVRPAERTHLGLAYSANEFAFATPENDRVPAGKAMSFDAAWGFAEAWTVGASGQVNLTVDPPLGRKLERGTVFAEYRPRCYVVRVGYAETVVPTVVGTVTEYALDRRVDVALDLTGLIGGAPPAPPNAQPATTAGARWPDREYVTTGRTALATATACAAPGGV